MQSVLNEWARTSSVEFAPYIGARMNLYGDDVAAPSFH